MSAFRFDRAGAARFVSSFAFAGALALSMIATSCSGSGAADSSGTTGGVTGGSTQTLPPAGDSLPGGTISFFKTKACPEGWAPFMEGSGRALVPMNEKDMPLAVNGMPLKDGEDRTHSHTMASASLTPIPVSYVGVVGGANTGVGDAQAVMFSVFVDKVSSGLPYIQLLACKKLGDPDASAPAVPKGMMIFYNGKTCPSGFTQPMATQGRVLVGLPMGAKAGITFGGASLKSAEGRTHTHAVNGTLTTTPHGIALASGCCGDGYAKDGMYPYTGTSSEDRVEMPTITVLQCQKD